MKEKVTEFFDRAGLTKYSALAGIDWKAATGFPRRPYWTHQGQCACGKRVYLFSRCWTCKRKDRFEEEESVEAFLERAGTRKKASSRQTRGDQKDKEVVIQDEVELIPSRTDEALVSPDTDPSFLQEPEAEDDLPLQIE